MTGLFTCLNGCERCQNVTEHDKQRNADSGNLQSVCKIIWFIFLLIFYFFLAV